MPIHIAQTAQMMPRTIRRYAKNVCTIPLIAF